LAYLYKTDVIEVNDTYEIYTSSPYWSPFPRSPIVFDLNYKDENFIIINNHLKCCGDGILDLNDPDDEETRRYLAANMLKGYVDDYLRYNKVFIIGDLNDDIAEESDNNVFQNILNDSENYLFADTELAHGSNADWSYPTWPSHLDHILITNELFEAFENVGSIIQTIKIDEYLADGWWEYEQNVSDHRPVAVKLTLDADLGIKGSTVSKSWLLNYPNPFKSATIFSFPAANHESEIEIRNIYGHLVFNEELSMGQNSLIWNAEGLSAGLYSARLMVNGNEIATTKLVVKK
jgi:hypothetical protein